MHLCRGRSKAASAIDYVETDEALLHPVEEQPLAVSRPRRSRA